MGSGAASAILPMTLLAGSAALYGSDYAGTYAFVLTLSAFGAQLLSAALVEARIGMGVSDLRLPSRLLWLSIVGLALSPAGLWLPAVGAVGMGLILMALDPARLSSIVNGGARVEFSVAVLIGVVALWLLLAPSALLIWIVAPIVATSAVVVRWRAYSGMEKRAFRLDGGWIVAETAVTGVTQPILNGAILGYLGPQASVAFRMTSSLINVFSPALTFARVRLLARASVGDLIMSSVVVIALAIGLLIPNIFGLWSFVFGESWVSVTTIAICAAIVWKIASLASTVPFARLRRTGYARLIFLLRLTSTLIYGVLALSTLFLFRDVSAVFISFAVSEVLTACLYGAFAWIKRSA